MATILEKTFDGLKKFGPCDRNELAKKTGLLPGQVSPALTVLSQRGSVKRSEDGAWSVQLPREEKGIETEEPCEHEVVDGKCSKCGDDSFPDEGDAGLPSVEEDGRREELEEKVKSLERRIRELELERDALTSAITDEGPVPVEEALEELEELRAKAGRWDMLSALTRQLISG